MVDCANIPLVKLYELILTLDKTVLTDVVVCCATMYCFRLSVYKIKPMLYGYIDG